MSNSWPAVLPKTAPAKSINDYSGELSAPNVRMLTNFAKKMHYNAHVVILPRATDVTSADSLAADAFSKWQLGGDDVLLVVDLNHATVGANIGANLANKGASSATIHQMVPVLGNKNAFSRGTTYGTIARVMRAVDHGGRGAAPVGGGGESQVVAPVSHAGVNVFSSMGAFAVLLLIATVLMFRASASSGTRRMSLNKSGKAQIGDGDDVADAIVQVPLREFAKRVHVKTPDEELDSDGTAAEGSADESMRKGRINTAEFIKKRPDQVEAVAKSAADHSMLESELGPPQTEGHATFAQLGTAIPESDSTFSNAESIAPESEQAKQFDATEQAETKPTKPELERQFQKDLGNYGDQMVQGDRDAPVDSSGAVPIPVSADASVPGSAAPAPAPPSFLEMAREHTSALPPPTPQSTALPGALSMAESPIEANELSSPMLNMPASPSYNLNLSGGFPDYSTTTGQPGESQAVTGTPQTAVLCPKCGAEKSPDFAFCLKCGQMFV